MFKSIFKKLSKKKRPNTIKTNLAKLLDHASSHKTYLNDIMNDKKGERAVSKWIFSYTKIHDNLKAGKINSNIKLLDKIIENSPETKETFIVYRGIRLKKNDNFYSENKSFTATSMDRDRALGFLYGNVGLLLEIEIPKGRKILSLVGESEEEEFLLGRNAQILIKNIVDNVAECILV